MSSALDGITALHTRTALVAVDLPKEHKRGGPTTLLRHLKHFSRYRSGIVPGIVPVLARPTEFSRQGKRQRSQA